MLIKTLSSREYIGTFAIGCCERTCREGAEAKIDWSDGYQDILFYCEGSFSHFDIRKIDIDEEMNSMMILLNDGTVIKTQDYYIPADVWEQYKS